MKEELFRRVKVRIPECDAQDGILVEYIRTVYDRLCIRLGAETLPDVFDSVCVDATVKMYRRTYYEGISSEGVANISTSFVEDILSEYAQEIGEWKMNRANSSDGGSGRLVRFL